MTSGPDSELENLLRQSATELYPQPLPSGANDPVLHRVTVYAALLRNAPAAAPGRHGRLLVAVKSDTVLAIPIEAEPIEIGRGPTCTVRLSDPEVSRRHCRILARRGHIWIEDLGSANGTWINDHRLRLRTRLRTGDLVRIGRTHFAVEHGNA